jgi:hypothetical protein
MVGDALVRFGFDPCRRGADRRIQENVCEAAISLLIRFRAPANT